jgi:hypothetical protein
MWTEVKLVYRTQFMNRLNVNELKTLINLSVDLNLCL